MLYEDGGGLRVNLNELCISVSLSKAAPDTELTMVYALLL